MRALTAQLAVAGLSLLVAVATGACGDDSEPQAVSRPASPARLRIAEPAPNQVTGPQVTVAAELTGARVVAGSGPVRPEEGHLHLFVDGVLASMEFTGTQALPPLRPGPHSVQVEFVAADDAPFRTRVIAAVLFTVEG